MACSHPRRVSPQYLCTHIVHASTSVCATAACVHPYRACPRRVRPLRACPQRVCVYYVRASTTCASTSVCVHYVRVHVGVCAHIVRVHVVCASTTCASAACVRCACASTVRVHPRHMCVCVVTKQRLGVPRRRPLRPLDPHKAARHKATYTHTPSLPGTP